METVLNESDFIEWKEFAEEMEGYFTFASDKKTPASIEFTFQDHPFIVQLIQLSDGHFQTQMIAPNILFESVGIAVAHQYYREKYRKQFTYSHKIGDFIDFHYQNLRFLDVVMDRRSRNEVTSLFFELGTRFECVFRGGEVIVNLDEIIWKRSQLEKCRSAILVFLDGETQFFKKFHDIAEEFNTDFFPERLSTGSESLFQIQIPYKNIVATLNFGLISPIGENLILSTCITCQRVSKYPDSYWIFSQKYLGFERRIINLRDYKSRYFGNGQSFKLYYEDEELTQKRMEKISSLITDNNPDTVYGTRSEIQYWFNGFITDIDRLEVALETLDLLQSTEYRFLHEYVEVDRQFSNYQYVVNVWKKAARLAGGKLVVSTESRLPLAIGVETEKTLVKAGIVQYMGRFTTSINSYTPGTSDFTFSSSRSASWKDIISNFFNPAENSGRLIVPGFSSNDDLEKLWISDKAIRLYNRINSDLMKEIYWMKIQYEKSILFNTDVEDNIEKLVSTIELSKILSQRGYEIMDRFKDLARELDGQISDAYKIWSPDGRVGLTFFHRNLGVIIDHILGRYMNDTKHIYTRIRFKRYEPQRDNFVICRKKAWRKTRKIINDYKVVPEKESLSQFQIRSSDITQLRKKKEKIEIESLERVDPTLIVGDSQRITFFLEGFIDDADRLKEAMEFGENLQELPKLKPQVGPYR